MASEPHQDVDAVLPAFQVGWNRRWTALAAAGSLAFTPVCLWFAEHLAFEGFGQLTPEGRIILAVMFALFALLFLSAAATYAAASFDERPVLTIDAAGVHDRRLTRRPIAWSLIASLTPLQKGGQMMLVLNLSDPKGQGLPTGPLWVVNRLSARLSGTEFAVRMTGLASRLDLVLEALQSRAPPRPQEPSSVSSLPL